MKQVNRNVIALCSDVRQQGGMKTYLHTIYSDGIQTHR